MKYLVHFRPDSELSDLIQLQDGIKIPGSGLHCTLCHFEMDPSRESQFIKDFYKTRFYPFDVDSLRFTELDNASIGLELSKPKELEKLHKETVRRARQYCEDYRLFDEVAKRYYFDNYLPHITISRNGAFDIHSADAAELLRRSFEVHQLILSKESQRWVEIVSIQAHSYEHA